LILPDKRYTFDKNRGYTAFDRLLKDESENVNESDTTHFEEVIASNPESQNYEKKQLLIREMTNNLHNRFVYHHLVNFEIITKLLIHRFFEVTYQQTAIQFHLITIAKK